MRILHLVEVNPTICKIHLSQQTTVPHSVKEQLTCFHYSQTQDRIEGHLPLRLQFYYRFRGF